MKKLYLAIVLCLMAINSYADQKGRFLRIECNQDLGLLELEANEITGDKIGDYFDQMKPFYKYSIDTDGENKSHAEILLINYLSDVKSPFVYQCNFSDKQGYNVDVSFVKDFTCDKYSMPTYAITITEYTNEKKVLIDNVKIGCASPLNNIQLVVSTEGKGANISFVGRAPSTFFMYDEIKEPLTNEKIKKEHDEQTILGETYIDEYGILRVNEIDNTGI